VFPSNGIYIVLTVIPYDEHIYENQRGWNSLKYEFESGIAEITTVRQHYNNKLQISAKTSLRQL